MSKKDNTDLVPIPETPLAALAFAAGVDPAYAGLLSKSVQAGIAAGATVRMRGPKALLRNGKTVSSVAAFPAAAIGNYLGTADTAAEADFLAPFQIGVRTTSPSGQKGTLSLTV